jgi:hypothetical protein
MPQMGFISKPCLITENQMNIKEKRKPKTCTELYYVSVKFAQLENAQNWWS